MFFLHKVRQTKRIFRLQVNHHFEQYGDDQNYSKIYQTNNWDNCPY